MCEVNQKCPQCLRAENQSRKEFLFAKFVRLVLEMAVKLIKRGEIHWVKLPLPSKQSKIRELQGPHPCLVVSNDEQNLFSPLITILPFTSQTDKIYPFKC